MRFVLTAIFGALAFFTYPEGVLHTPLSQLTLMMVLRCIAAISFSIAAIRALFESSD
jgi:putative Ca2+/H+ antiporter (TMEM165/GDT1 family)